MITFTQVHVVISLLGIASGLVIMYGLLGARRFDRWTAVFLITTIATSVTGFLFPFHGFTPGIGLGIVSLVVLAPAVVARYAYHLNGSWRWVYVSCAMLAQYLNVFGLIAQLFQKVPALNALAPTQTGPAFLAVQLFTLALFLVLTIVSVIRFRVPTLERSVV